MGNGRGTLGRPSQQQICAVGSAKPCWTVQLGRGTGHDETALIMLWAPLPILVLVGFFTSCFTSCCCCGNVWWSFSTHTLTPSRCQSPTLPPTLAHHTSIGFEVNVRATVTHSLGDGRVPVSSGLDMLPREASSLQRGKLATKCEGSRTHGQLREQPRHHRRSRTRTHSDGGVYF